MEKYLICVKILGGEWELLRVNGHIFETASLDIALGMEATVLDSIRETMVVRFSHEALILDTGELVEAVTFEAVL